MSFLSNCLICKLFSAKTHGQPKRGLCFETLKNRRQDKCRQSVFISEFLDKTAGFKLTFSSCIVKNTCKISPVLVSPKSALWLGLRDRKCQDFACDMLQIAGKCIFQCKLRYLGKATLQSDFRMKNVFQMRKT